MLRGARRARTGGGGARQQQGGGELGVSWARSLAQLASFTAARRHAGPSPTFQLGQSQSQSQARAQPPRAGASVLAKRARARAKSHRSFSLGSSASRGTGSLIPLSTTTGASAAATHTDPLCTLLPALTTLYSTFAAHGSSHRRRSGSSSSITQRAPLDLHLASPARTGIFTGTGSYGNAVVSAQRRSLSSAGVRGVGVGWSRHVSAVTLATRSFVTTRSVRKDQDKDEKKKKEDESELGHVYATSSGLFKLRLPLPPAPAAMPIDSDGTTASSSSSSDDIPRVITASSSAPPEASALSHGRDAAHGEDTENSTSGSGTDAGVVMFLLHPRQPLSFLAALILAETAQQPGTKVRFLSQDTDAQDRANKAGRAKGARWAQATELGDFVRDASKGKRFDIVLAHPTAPPPSDGGAERETVISVQVPTFAERTRWLRMRLRHVSRQMNSLMKVKREADTLAVKGAQRFAKIGFAGMSVYWFIVYWFTFHSELSWDVLSVMEPVTYLTGLSALMGGYLWFLYHQREVSYQNVFAFTTAKRRETLYKERGFDQEHWHDLVDEGTSLRRSIKKIAVEYDVDWDTQKELENDHVLEEQEDYLAGPRSGRQGQHGKGKDGEKKGDGEDEPPAPAESIAEVLREHAEQDDAARRAKQSRNKREDADKESELEEANARKGPATPS